MSQRGSWHTPSDADDDRGKSEDGREAAPRQCVAARLCFHRFGDGGAGREPPIGMLAEKTKLYEEHVLIAVVEPRSADIARRPELAFDRCLGIRTGCGGSEHSRAL